MGHPVTCPACLGGGEHPPVCLGAAWYPPWMVLPDTRFGERSWQAHGALTSSVTEQSEVRMGVGDELEAPSVAAVPVGFTWTHLSGSR